MAIKNIEMQQKTDTGYDTLYPRTTSNNVIYGSSTIDQIVNAINPLRGTSNPTTSTQGVVGQFYLNTNTGTLFLCVNVSGISYGWVELVSVGGCTFRGDVTFGSSAYMDGATELDTAQARNISIGTVELQDGVSPLATGQLHCVYKSE